MLERLARGGMSTVYSAVDERLDRPVAVKVMSAALSTDPAFADRFAREARVAARLSHLNAVAVYDQGADAGHVFLVMELVRGRTLRDLLRERGVLTPAEAVSILEPVLGALAAAHRAGLVHRDVKPENILLSDDGVVKVADFGLARAIEADASSTRTGLMMGTVAYCPPEQIARGSADARSDVYAAGVVLFELLTGSAPYVGDSAMAVAYQHVNSDVPPPSSRRPGIPRQLDEVVLRATSREPSGRPLDAGAFLAELHDARIDLGLPVVAVPPSPRSGASAAETQQIRRVTGRPGPNATTAPTYSPGGAEEFQHTAVQDVDAPPPGWQPPRSPNRQPGLQPPAQQYGGQQAAPQQFAGQQHGQPVTPSRPASRRRKARRRATILVVLILVLGLLTGYGAWYLAVGRYHQVPHVDGQSKAIATAQLQTAGFAVSPDIELEFSETAPAGTVLGTHPDAGAHLLGGKSVELVLSKGAERFLVPDVTGKPFDQAEQAFSGIPVRLKRSNTSDGTGRVASGRVLRTAPSTAAKVRRDSVVTVYVSTGPPVLTVPDVAGRGQDDASATLSEAGFKVEVAQDFSTSVPQGSVIRQNPAGDGSAPKFSVVTLVVSKGPPVVAIPKIHIGESVDEATSALEAAGLKVATKKLADAVIFHEVWSVSPRPGNEVPLGSTVTLTIF